jgi:hypothetical protein
VKGDGSEMRRDFHLQFSLGSFVTQEKSRQEKMVAVNIYSMVAYGTTTSILLQCHHHFSTALPKTLQPQENVRQ